MENKTLGQIALSIMFIWCLVVASFFVYNIFYKDQHKTQIVQQTITNPTEVQVVVINKTTSPEFVKECTKIAIEGQPNLFYCEEQ